MSNPRALNKVFSTGLCNTVFCIQNVLMQTQSWLSRRPKTLGIPNDLSQSDGQRSVVPTWPLPPSELSVETFPNNREYFEFSVAEVLKAAFSRWKRILRRCRQPGLPNVSRLSMGDSQNLIPNQLHTACEA